MISHDCGALTNGISALTQEIPRAPLSLLSREDTEKRALYEPESLPSDTESADALNLDVLALRTMINKILLFISNINNNIDNSLYLI